MLGWFGDDPERLARFVELDEESVDQPDWLERAERWHTTQDDEVPPLLAEVDRPSPRQVLERLQGEVAQIRRGAAGGRPTTARDPSRLAVALIAREDLRLEVADLAEFYGVTSSYVRSATTRARRRYETDPRFRELVRSLRSDAA